MRHSEWKLLLIGAAFAGTGFIGAQSGHSQKLNSVPKPPPPPVPLSELQKSQSEITGYLNVHAFGALGTGKDDETEAVQSALAHACSDNADNPNGGAEVYFPAGIYPVHGLRVTCGNVLIRGAGPNSTQLQYDGPQNSGPYPVTPSPAAYVLAFTRGASWGGLRDMEIFAYTTMQPIRGIATDLVLLQGPIDAEVEFSNLALDHPIHDAIHMLQYAPGISPEAMAATHGYTTANNVPVSGGSGTGMTVNLQAVDGHITAMKIAAQGSGYAQGEELTVAEPGSGGDARFTVGAGTVFFNWFMHQIRIDGTGGYGIHIEGLQPMDGAPFSLDDFTWTTVIAQPEWLLKNGYLQGYTPSVTPWGRGVIGMLGGRGYQLSLSNGRVEGGQPQSPVGPGQEANLFSHEMPVQPAIELHTHGEAVASVSIRRGGFGWNEGNIHAEYSGCSKNPEIVWTVSASVVVGAKVLSPGTCNGNAGVVLREDSVNDSFLASDITGFISARYAVPLIYSSSGIDAMRLDNVRVDGAMGDYMNGRTGGLSSAGVLTASDRLAYMQAQTGWSSQGHAFLAASDQDLLYGGSSVKAGDIIFHNASDYASKPYGQIGAYRIITYPRNGYTMLRARRNLCDGNLTPSGRQWTGCTPQQLRAAQVSVDAALTFPSGDSGRSLDTWVTDVDWATGAITTAAAGSSASTVNYTTPQWRDSHPTAPGYPTSPDEVYYQGEVIYNSAPAPGRPIWWSCTLKTCTGGSGWIDGPAYGAEHRN
jgi:Pectate lyase superfamily protein